MSMQEHNSNWNSVPQANRRGRRAAAARARSRRRRPYGSYKASIERRAVLAAGMVLEKGWTAKHAASVMCVSPTYVGLVRHLDEDGRHRLLVGDLTLAQLHRERRQHLAERRCKERDDEIERAGLEALMREGREEAAQRVDDVLDAVALDRVIEGIVDRFGAKPLLSDLDLVLSRQGRDIVALVTDLFGAERVWRALDRITAPLAEAAE
jgi:hypothetical protein